MRVEIKVVPPGGGSTDYTIAADLPAVPAVGDYLILREPPWPSSSSGQRSHIVRRARWYLEDADRHGSKKLATIALEVELAEGGVLDSQKHIEHLAKYSAQGKRPEQLEWI
jgi:hypothetical protein